MDGLVNSNDMTAPYKISYFVRFGERLFLEQTVSNGTIFMNTIEHFQSIEGHNERADKYENITGYYQPQDIELKINNRTIKDLIGPLTVYFPCEDKFNVSHIFSLSHLPETYTPREDGKIFDERMTNFESLVLLKPKYFVDKMVKALNKLKKDSKIYNYSYGLVEYIPKETYSGSMNPFKKTDNYAHQQEFRFAVSAVDRTQPLIFNLGCLQDIALEILDISKFKNHVEISSDGKINLAFS